jgi:hypothetical protein
MSTMQSDNEKESLALSIACGRTVQSWAKRHAVEFTEAYEISIQNEFRPRVETARLRVADRMVGKLTSGANIAIAQLVRLCTKSASDSIRLSASRAILTHWLKVSQHFYVKVKIKALEEFLDRLDNKVKAREGRRQYPYPRTAPAGQ